MMFTNFIHAPNGTTLCIERINNEQLEADLFRMGVAVGNTVYRMNAELDLHTVKIRHAGGDTVLSGGMGGKVLGHLDDGRIIALTDMKTGEKGHIETVEGGEDLISAMQNLGLCHGQEFEMIRILPPMEYITLINGKRRERLSEGMAAKILGTLDNGRHCQFANSCAGSKFTVDKIIGGENAQKIMQAFNIFQGDVLILESVEHAATCKLSQTEHFILTNTTGLRIYLKKDQAEAIIVSYKEKE